MPHHLLQASEVQALLSYLDHDAVPTIVMNLDYEILAANTACQRQFGMAGRPFLGRKCYATSHRYDRPCDQAGEHCPMRSALASHAPDRVLHIHHTPRGPEHVDVELRPIIDAHHQMVGFVERLQTGLTETLFESELFGYERGAFTGASQRKRGLVETAKGGTLFLDEIGDVALAMQVKLLRLIESGTYRRVGGVESLQADFRLVAATHKPLREMVAEKLFREDLFYRISTFPIRLPPLRERRQDIPILVDSLLARSANANGIPMQASRSALDILESHEWPGNVREWRNVLEQGRLFADDGMIRPEHLGFDIPVNFQPKPTSASDDAGFREYVKRFKESRRALASALGMSERSLYRKLSMLKSDSVDRPCPPQAE